jgi:hypothetical protein
MSQQVDKAFRNFTAGEALNAFCRVKLSSGTIVYADDEDAAIGVTQEACADGDRVAVKLIAGGVGTFKVRAADAISASAAVYAGDDGEVEGSGTVARGTALEESTAAHDIIECILTS